MKIKEGYMLRTVAGSNIVVPVGSAVMDFNGMINLNETGALLWSILEKGADEDDLVKALLKEYEIDEDTARKDVGIFVSKMKEASLIDEQ